MFWILWQKRKLEYKEAIFLEKELLNNFSEEKYENVADKKSAFGKIAIDSLHLLSKSKDDKLLYQNLLQSHRYFSLGFQIYDDVLDFKEDFTKNQFNLAIHQLSKKIDFKQYKDIETLNKIFYITGSCFELLQKSIDSFEKAKSYINDTNSSWYNTIDEMQTAVSVFYDKIIGYIETLKVKNNLKKTPNYNSFFDYEHISHFIIKRGIDFIANDFENNYIELKHYMWLSQKEDFDNEQQLHYSDTFQRAMLGDCLLHISEKFNLKTGNFFQKAINYFLERTNKDEIGAWSYFQTVQEIAADIDDLGQIMQFFILTKNKNWIDKFCLKAIKIAIEERTTKNGGIETWIIPKKPTNEKQEKQDFFNKTKWGKGPDVEVVANFLYSLFFYNFKKYSETIKKEFYILFLNKKKKDFGKVAGIMAIITELILVFVYSIVTLKNILNQNKKHCNIYKKIKTKTEVSEQKKIVFYPLLLQ